MKLDICIAVPGLPFNGETFSKQSLGGCVVGDTPIDIPRDLRAFPAGIPIREVSERLRTGERLKAYSYDHALGRIVLRPITKAWRTKQAAEVWELTYAWVSPDGDERAATLRATPDHRIMLRDGTYIAMSDLVAGDSLMPFNRFQGPRRNAKYFRIDLNNGQWDYEHQFIVRELGIPYRPKRGTEGDVVHHANFRWYDNTDINLRVMEWKAHLALHKGSNQAFREWYDNLTPTEYAEFSEKQRQLSQGYWGQMTPAERRIANAPSVRRLARWHRNATQDQLDAKYSKISNANREAWKTPRLRDILIQNGKAAGGRNKGTHHTEESKARMRAAKADPLLKVAHAAACKGAWGALTLDQRRMRTAPMLHARGIEISNHAVVSVRRLDIREDVYDLEVPGTHNFAANGIVIHNSESAGYYMGRALAKLGHRVTVFCSTERVRCADVDYMPIDSFKQYVEHTSHDVCIVQRVPELFSVYCRARFSAFWCHDLALGRREDLVKGVAWNYDKLFVLSDFMKRQYQDVYKLPDELLFQTRNGVDLAAVAAVRAALSDKVKRNPLSLVFSARPERGLDVLLAEIMPRILKEEPKARLFLSAYKNPVDELKVYYAQCDQLAARLGDRVVKLGELTKAQLYEVYHASGAYVYPVPALLAPEFDEISCVTGDTLVDMPRDYSIYPHGVQIKELVGKSGFPVYCYDSENARITLGTVKWAAMTKRKTEVWRLKLDDGSSIRATPEHKIMRRDGTWCELRHLSVGDSLMPLYKHIHISVNLNNGWENEHRLVGEWMAGRGLNGHEEHVHHVNGYWDTSPGNLQVLSRSEHFSITHKGKKRSAIERERQRTSLRGFFASLSAAEREKYFAGRPKAVRSMWEKQKSLPEKEYRAWLKSRSEKRDLSFMRTPEWREMCKVGGTASINKQWRRVNALPAEQRQAWLDVRTERMREARWNHSVVAIEPDGFEDVYDMEVEKHHNFVAGGVVVHNCISLMEAQACGLPVVSSARGALPETLAPGAGTLIAEPVHTPAYYDAFAVAALRFMRSEDAWSAASVEGLQRAETLSWDGVAQDWQALFEQEIAKFSADKATLANHFWRRSDIYAAQACLALLPADDAKSAYVRERVEHDFAFALTEPDGFRRQYERIGATHDAAVIDWAPHEPRYAALRQWLERRLKERPEAEGGYSILDYGCAHGAYAVNLLKELPRLTAVGVDLDTHGVQMAYGFAEKLDVRDRWAGVVGDHTRLSDASLPEMAVQYDAVVAQEVLEHVEDPAAVLAALEARVKDDGYVYLTIPFGPWEFTDYHRYPYRAHVREFDAHDLHDLLDPKDRTADVTISVMPYGHSPETDDSLGWFVVQYKVTPTTRGALGTLDMARKLWLQRPRQTVSAAIIAGPNCEETLHWTLRSLEHVADEVVIADCGLSDEAKRLIADYQWRDFDDRPLAAQRGQRHFLPIVVIPGADPKTQGFETARNLALARCTQDWVLWIDTDEKLLQPERFSKYLRSNIFQGYSIRQHHFAVDTHFDPDLPVRLFRNNGRLKFFGMIHEHPEEALNKGPGRTIVISDVHIPHVGYLIESGRQVRFGRNYPMLQADLAKYPDRLLQKHFIMRDSMLMCTYELARNGGLVTPDMQEKCKEVVKIYREHFLGKGHFTNADPITYYSQANAVLGQGFDTAFQVSADKVDAKVNGATKVRFANTEDFVTELTFRARDSSQRFESRYW